VRLSLTTTGLLDPKRLDSWLPAKRRAIRQAVEAGMKQGSKELVDAARSRMQSSFKVRKAAFVKSMRARVYAGTPDKFPALLIGSKIPWLGIHLRGGTISGRMLIPLLPEHQRMGRVAFKRVVDGLMRTGNAYFIKKNGKVILMAESIKENQSELRRFKKAHRLATGAKTVRRGTEIPIAVLVNSVTLSKRFDLAEVVRSGIPALTNHIKEHLDRHGL
jgi:hypothetical protein